MVTIGDVQYEPPVPKVLFLTQSIAVLSAGDAGFQREVLNVLQSRVQAAIESDPDHWLSVADMVQAYVQLRNEAKLRRSEAALLQPLGMTVQTFQSMQATLASELVTRIATDLVNFSVPSAECIFTGVDITGPHIYAVYDGQVVCQDAVAFACVGSGATHAASQFMLAQHTAWQDVAETLYVCYNAKKRSEVAPGVGTETDLFLIGPQLGSSTLLPLNINNQLDVEYLRVVAAERAAATDARQGISAYVQAIVNRPEAGQEAIDPASGSIVTEPFGSDQPSAADSERDPP